ncbi:hypothetical protein AVEN_78155-1 [Araneus ventricosus]|uniref:Uncharacterized protein n=1 Tax=Araneus ventricosus TaxID=182803 RepID=A0A4Y2MS61_ARAVE|nr:hypothetical protein AVEN_78155-1 [Araneus ventricosus]
MNEIYKKLGITKLTTLVYNPQSSSLIERLIKVEKREIFPTVQSENSFAEEADRDMGNNNDTVSNEESILKVYPCCSLPYEDWGDDQQNLISNAIQNSHMSTQCDQYSTNTSNISECEETNSAVSDMIQNQSDDHTIVTLIQQSTNMPMNAESDKNTTHVADQDQNQSVIKQAPVGRRYGLRPRGAFGFVKHN